MDSPYRAFNYEPLWLNERMNRYVITFWYEELQACTRHHPHKRRIMDPLYHFYFWISLKLRLSAASVKC